MQRQMHKYTNRKIQSTLKGECTKDEQDSIILYNSNQLLYLKRTNAMQRQKQIQIEPKSKQNYNNKKCSLCWSVLTVIDFYVWSRQL